MSDIVVIATANLDKAREIAELLRDIPFELQCLSDFPPVPEPEENGATFCENAVGKAAYYSRNLNLPCISDDSGLEVYVLNGAPGIYSARYAGSPPSYERNNAKLLEALRGVDDANRGARFVCCAAVVFPDGTTHVETGVVEGKIAATCRGSYGFGYDPLFIPKGYEQTFGELSPILKQSISHRANAFRQLRDYLVSLA